MKNKILGAATLTLLLAAGAVNAQTSTSTTSTAPGTPNTGAGGDSTANIIVLGASALTALAGATYLMRKRALR